MSHSPQVLQNLRQSLKNRQDFLPFEFLGRSLAYNPYTPRADVDNFRRPKSCQIAGKILLTPSFGYEMLAEFLSQDCEAIAVDFSSSYKDNIPSADMLDCLTHLRRYSEKFIIHNDIFISQYQLLESVIYGSDGVILEAGILSKELSNMYDFACRLGLVGIIKVNSLEELKLAIFAKADIIYIAQDFLNILNATPNSKVIFADLPSGLEMIDEKNSYGVDMFLVSKSNSINVKNILVKR